MTAEEAEQSGITPQLLTVPFGQNANAFVVAARLTYLASQHGGGWLADVTMRQVFQHDNQWYDCVTEIQPRKRGDRPAPRVTEAGPTRIVSQVVTDWVDSCQTRTSHVVTSTPGRVGGPNGALIVNRDCAVVPVSVYATRWEHQIQAGYVPGDWALVFRTATRGMVFQESTPACEPLNRSLDPVQPHVIEAHFYRGAH